MTDKEWERLEQIRQLEEDVALVRGDTELMRKRALYFSDDESWMREYVRWCRIVARLESALADLKQGRK